MQAVSAYIDSLYCIEEGERAKYEIYGDYNSKTASNLIVVYETCDPQKRRCKSPEVIDEALEMAYVLTITNKQKFYH